MRIAIVWSSPNIDGLTANAKNQIIAGLERAGAEADGIVFVSAVYWFDLTECMKAFTDRLRRCDTLVNHALHGKSCLLVACAGGSGNGAIECLGNLERTTRHMGMAALDRLPVTRFNRGYMLPALVAAGKRYGAALSSPMER